MDPNSLEVELPYGDQLHLVKSLSVPLDAENALWGASVLPFSLLPEDNVYFLLGREQNWKSIGGDGHWCGFGGQHDNGEHEVDEVASREW